MVVKYISTQITRISPLIRFALSACPGGAVTAKSTHPRFIILRVPRIFWLTISPERPTQIAEGKNLVPSVVSDTENDKLDNYLVNFQNHSGVCDDNIHKILECYLNLPEAEVPKENPLNYSHIREHQQSDEKLLHLQQKFPSQYIKKTLDNSVSQLFATSSRTMILDINGKSLYPKI